MYQPSVSFCIITNGLRPAALKEGIKSIHALKIKDYEILVGGEILDETLDTSIKRIPAIQAAREGRLGEMRNKLKKETTKDIIVVCDDDILFQDDFYTGLCQHDPNFDIQCVRILNPDGSRYWDWAVVESPDGHHLIDYAEDSPYVYITGGLCILHSKLKNIIDWPEENGFYEGEDVSFTKKVKEKGLTISCNPKASVIHNDPRMSQVEDFPLRMDSPYNWQVHSSGVLIKGANPGSSKCFTVRKNFELEVPLRFLNQPNKLNIGLALFAAPSLYKNGKLNLKIKQNDQIIQELSFSEECQHLSFNLSLPISNAPLRFKIEASEELFSAWNNIPRDRIFASLLVYELNINSLLNLPAQNPEVKKELIALQNNLNSVATLPPTKGICLAWPIATGNPHTSILKSLIEDINKNFDGLVLSPSIVEQDVILEIKENKNNERAWLDLIQKDLEPSVHIELFENNQAQSVLYKTNLKKRLEKKNISPLFIDTKTDVVLNDGIYGYRLTFNQQNYFLPLALDKDLLTSALIEPLLNKTSRQLIGVEINLKNTEGLGDLLKNLIKLSQEIDIELVLFPRELTSNRLTPKLSVVLEQICIDQKINQEHFPDTLCLDKTPTEKELIALYKSLDSVIQINEQTSIAHSLLPLALNRQVISIQRETDNRIGCPKGMHILLRGKEAHLSTKLKEILNKPSLPESPTILDQYDSKKSVLIWANVFNSILNNVPSNRVETKIIELDQTISNETNSSYPTPHILLDMRSVIGCEGNLVRGIGQYSLSHALSLISTYPNWHFSILVNDQILFSQVKSIFSQQNVTAISACEINNYKFDVFHAYDPLGLSSGYHSPFLLLPEIPRSAILYDLIPLQENNHFLPNQLYQQSAYNLALNLLRNSNAHLLSISNYTREIALRELNYKPELISTIYGAPSTYLPKESPKCDHGESWDISQQKKPFFMTVGSLEPRKNFPFAFNVFIEAAKYIDIELIVIGSLQDPYKRTYKEELENCGITNVKFVGFLEETELKKAYEKASGLLFFSEHEGLGLPPIEAMQAGCPVFVSNKSCLPEIVGNGGIISDLTNVSAVAKEMIRIVQDSAHKKQWCQRGQQQAARFTWNEAIRETVKAWAGMSEVFLPWMEQVNQIPIITSPKRQNENYLETQAVF